MLYPVEVDGYTYIFFNFLPFILEEQLTMFQSVYHVFTYYGSGIYWCCFIVGVVVFLLLLFIVSARWLSEFGATLPSEKHKTVRTNLVNREKCTYPALLSALLSADSFMLKQSVVE